METDRLEGKKLESPAALEVVVSGRVQGVGYRFFCQRKAHLFGVCGWARNRADGTVQVMAVGPPDAVKEFIEELGRGPKFGKVEDISVTDVPNANISSDEYIEFKIR